jgi:hypothetical protein
MELLPLENKSSQKKIIIFTHSGLNNRLLPLISGFRAAEILNRQLLVYWSDTPRRTGMRYHGNSGLRFNDLFENPVDEVSLDEINDLEGAKWFTDWRGLDCSKWPQPAGFNVKNPEVITGDTIPGNIDDEVIVVRTSRLFGVEGDNPGLDYLNNTKCSYLSAPQIVSDLRSYAALLKPVKEISGIIEEHKHVLGKHMLGLHIRKTDFRKYRSFKYENEHIAQLAEARVLQYGPEKIYLSTDCIKTEGWFKEYFGSQLLTYNDVRKFENSDAGTKHALVDLYLLSKCQWILGTIHSTFSVGAWLLSENASLEGLWWTEK